MRTASKSPRRVAAVAMAVGKRTLPRYGHRFSRHDSVLAQHFACLVLRQFFRADYRGIDSLIPAVIGRPSNVLPVDPWRWLMATDFDEETYGQRRQVETGMFMLKRHQGAALGARTEATRRNEMALMAVTQNILIVRTEELSYKALPTPLMLRN